jgi:hypothetical protein
MVSSQDNKKGRGLRPDLQNLQQATLHKNHPVGARRDTRAKKEPSTWFLNSRPVNPNSNSMTEA